MGMESSVRVELGCQVKPSGFDRRERRKRDY